DIVHVTPVCFFILWFICSCSRRLRAYPPLEGEGRRRRRRGGVNCEAKRFTPTRPLSLARKRSTSPLQGEARGACLVGTALNPLLTEARLHARAVDLERAVRADRVGALEHPVLPGGEPPEDFRLQGFRAGEAQVRLHGGERVG